MNKPEGEAAPAAADEVNLASRLGGEFPVRVERRGDKVVQIYADGTEIEAA